MCVCVCVCVCVCMTMLGLLVAARGLRCSKTCGILVPGPGIEFTSPALEGGFLTTELPGKPQVKMSWGHPDHLDGFHIQRQMSSQETEKKTQIQRRRPCEDGQRLERFSCKPIEFWSHQKLKDQRKDSLLRLWEEYGPDNTLTLDFWPPEQWMNTFLVY